MSDEQELSGEPTTEPVNNANSSTNQHSEMAVLQIINEKGEQHLETNKVQEPTFPASLPDDEIITAQKGESETDNVQKSTFPVFPGNHIIIAQKDELEEPGRYYNYEDDRSHGQTPYYQQQRVAGQPVYVQGRPPPEPVNAARMVTYRQRRDDDDNNYSVDRSIFHDSFDDMAIRNRFVQRVYTILSVQLIYTCAFTALCIFEEHVKYFILHNIAFFFAALAVEMVVYFALICCIAARRNFPLNFILLALFTVAFAYITACVSAIYSTFIVITSMGITAGICVLISIIACQTSFDITSWGMYLCVIGLIVIIFGFIATLVVLITGSRIMFLIYAGLIALLFSLYLMYDTQMIMGGRRIELSPEEYIFGALCLYVDIIEIFWAILTLLGMSRN